MCGRDQEGREQYKAYCPIQVGSLTTHALVDSGNSVGNAMSWDFAQAVGLRECDLEIDPHLSRVNTAKKNDSLKVMGRPKQRLTLRLGGLQTKFKIRPIIIQGLTMSFNISGPFLKKHNIDQLHSRQVLRVQGQEIKLVRAGSYEEIQALQKMEPSHSTVYVDQDTEVPANSAIFVPLRVPNVEQRKVQPTDGILEAQAHFVSHTDLHPVLAALTRVDKNGKTWTSVINSTKETIKIPAGLKYGEFKKNAAHSDMKQDKTEINISCENEEWYVNKFKLNESPFLKKEEDRKAAVKLLQEYHDLFSHNDNYGKTSLVTHDIHTQEGPPIKCRHRPINPILEQNLKEQVDHWKEQGVIEPSSSPWSFPLLAVPKKNGKTRWCVDYRRLNDVTIKDSFPLPQIEDNLARLANSRIFSGIDGTGAYHVVSIREQDKEKTAFSTPWGLFQFKQMPFGLCNAPATYCRLVQKVLEGIPLSIAIPYLDDTCIHSCTLTEHLDGLRKVFQAHRRAGLTLQPEKCQLFRDKIQYLGHEISETGISVPGEYTKIVRTWPVPSNIKEVRTFLGKVSYYRRFIKDFSRISSPLSELTKDEQTEKEFKWTPEAQTAFIQLKAALQKAPILAYPQFHSDKPFIVDTDWSGDPGAIGGVLSQEQDGEERVIAYGAKKLCQAEKNYSSNKGELLAAVFFIRYWKYYLSHRPFILRTDHEALKWIRSIEEPKNMILRWLTTLSNHDFTVQFRKGKQHGNADALSRTEHADFLNREEINDDHVAAIQVPGGTSRVELLKSQQEDEVLQQVVQWVETDQWPQKQELRAKSRAHKAYAALRGTLQVASDGILERIDPQARGVLERRPCIPLSQQVDLLQKVHEESGHRGSTNTFEQFNRRFYYPGAATEAVILVETCNICQKNRPKPKAQQHTLVSQPIGEPFQKWSIDFVGPLPTSAQGNNYILTAKDCFTRWIEAIPTNNMTATTVVKTLERELFARYGIPEQIHSDQGTQFTSQMMNEIYRELGIIGTRTPAYNPKSNPVERTHRDLGQLLRACVDNHPQDWEDFLPDCLLAMRVAVNRGTGFSPFSMVYGKEAVLPIDVVYGRPYGDPKSPAEQVNKLRARMEVAFETARNEQKKAIIRARRLYSKMPAEGVLKEDDKVWLFTPRSTGNSRKLSTHWTGPWTIVKCISPVVFQLKSGDWNRSTLIITAGLDRIRRCRHRPEPPEVPHDLQVRDVHVADEFQELPHLPDDAAAAVNGDGGPHHSPSVVGGGGGGGGGPTNQKGRPLSTWRLGGFGAPPLQEGQHGHGRDQPHHGQEDGEPNPPQAVSEHGQVPQMQQVPGLGFRQQHQAVGQAQPHGGEPHQGERGAEHQEELGHHVEDAEMSEPEFDMDMHESTLQLGTDFATPQIGHGSEEEEENDMMEDDNNAVTEQEKVPLSQKEVTKSATNGTAKRIRDESGTEEYEQPPPFNPIFLRQLKPRQSDKRDNATLNVNTHDTTNDGTQSKSERLQSYQEEEAETVRSDKSFRGFSAQERGQEESEEKRRNLQKLFEEFEAENRELLPSTLTQRSVQVANQKDRRKFEIENKLEQRTQEKDEEFHAQQQIREKKQKKKEEIDDPSWTPGTKGEKKKKKKTEATSSAFETGGDSAHDPSKFCEESDSCAPTGKSAAATSAATSTAAATSEKIESAAAATDGRKDDSFGLLPYAMRPHEDISFSQPEREGEESESYVSEPISEGEKGERRKTSSEKSLREEKEKEERRKSSDISSTPTEKGLQFVKLDAPVWPPLISDTLAPKATLVPAKPTSTTWGTKSLPRPESAGGWTSSESYEPTPAAGATAKASMEMPPPLLPKKAKRPAPTVSSSRSERSPPTKHRGRSLGRQEVKPPETRPQPPSPPPAAEAKKRQKPPPSQGSMTPSTAPPDRRRARPGRPSP